MASVLEQFEKIPIKQRGLVLLLLCAMVGAVFFYLVYQPKAQEIKLAQGRLATLTSEVQNLQTIEAKNKEFKRMIGDLRVQLDAARQQLPGEREIPVLLEQIALFGKEAGVDFTSFRPGGEVKKDLTASPTPVPRPRRKPGSHGSKAA